MAQTTPYSLTQLNDRSKDIFRCLVESYLDSGEPVGSRNLSRASALSLSPASIRNVMADLEQAGLIYAPHTSAGRLPTEAGLRLFVDAILEIGDLGAEERSHIDAELHASGNHKPIESVLNEASSLLSGLSHGAGIVLAGKRDVKLKHIEFVALDLMRALVVLVTEDGAVENRIVDLPAGLPPSALIEATNFLNNFLRGHSLAEARIAIEKNLKERNAALDDLTAKLVKQGLASLSEAPDGGSKLLIVHGRANLLQNLSAMDDLERVRLLFEDLEKEKDIIELLNAAEIAEGVRIFIGSENKLFSLSGSSVIAAPFRDENQTIIGVLGIIGPTRLNYGRIVPMVDYTAKLVSRLMGSQIPS
jgi:heat-inducible transcriptional repressor